MAMTLPAGEVTLLFTDIEGSTKLLDMLGDRYVESLIEHRRLLRSAFAEHHGYEVDTQGDAFFVAFERPIDAARAAIAAQTALAAATWPEGQPVRVRMGIHLGRPTLIAGGYVGMDLHKGARICSAGHGGQVVLSSQVAEALAAAGFASAKLRDLGDHRLKDLPKPERLFQVEIDGIENEFPPLRSISPSNLPAEVSSFIGRTRDLGDLIDVVKRDDVRHVTLTGAGGTGKTRLALAAARSLHDGSLFDAGVFFVPLASLSDATFIPSAIATALGVSSPPGQSLVDAIKAYVSSRRLLIVIDNFEHLLDGAAIVAEVLSAGPFAKVMVTSRMVLRTTGEYEFSVPPLGVPAHADDLGSIAESDAVVLFAERAAALDANFSLAEHAAAIAQICAKLDGLPLAIELAASRVKTIPPPTMVKRLERRLDVLTTGARDAPERQRTLRATLEWSHALLTAAEREVFARLSVFAGGFTDDAATSVASGGEEDGVIDLLAGLVEANLVQRQPVSGETRFAMLETIREFAKESLEKSGNEKAVAMRHALWFADLAEGARPALRAPEQEVWLDRLEREHDNMRAAMRFAADEAPDIAARLAGSLAWFWDIRGYLDEGRLWSDLALERARSAGISPSPWLLLSIGRLSIVQDRKENVEPFLEESVRLFERLDDTRGRVIALTHLGWAVEQRGDWDRSLRLHRQALEVARAGNDDWSLGVALHNIGDTLWQAGDRDAGARFVEESLPVRRRAGEKYGLVYSLNTLGGIRMQQGNVEEAVALLEEGAHVARQLGSVTTLCFVLGNLGHGRLALGDVDQAVLSFGESTRLAMDMRIVGVLRENLNGLATIAARRGDLERAARLAGAAAAVADNAGALVGDVERGSMDELAAAANSVGNETWGVEFDRGREMDTGAAVTYALE